LKTGLWITTFNMIEKNIEGSADFFRGIEAQMDNP
jgi:hypothetical protein